MADIRHKRGTRAALNALALASGLKAGQLYVLTDEARIAIALDASTYQTFAKQSEAASGSGASLKIADVDLGSTARHSGVFTITDAAIAAGQKLLVQLGPGPYTGKGTRADEAEMSPGVTFTATATAGSATVRWCSPRGSALRGRVNVQYMIGA